MLNKGAGIFICFLVAFGALTSAKVLTVEKGRKVTIDYTLTVDGKLVDSSEKSGPFTYTQGEGQVISGLEKGIAGMQVGEEKEIVVSPQEGYGEVNPQAFKEVNRSALPAGLKPEPGMVLRAKRSDGKIIPVRIAKVKKDTVVLDFNHPLAGKTLKFDVKVLSIK